jgi:hypothetical protein
MKNWKECEEDGDLQGKVHTIHELIMKKKPWRSG